MKTIKIGCCGWLALFLTVLFVILKLLGAIHWAWVWVASPAWIIFLFVAFDGETIANSIFFICGLVKISLQRYSLLCYKRQSARTI